MSKVGVYVGRLCPIHLGHEKVIEFMIDEFWIDKCILLLGSCNANFSLRNFFSYTERKSFIQKIYPQLTITGIPDYGSNEDWLGHLDDILMTKWNKDILNHVTFMWGCEEDVDFFLETWRQVKIYNRFNGTTPKISATEVRDALIERRDLKWLLNENIIEDVKSIFYPKWEKFKKI